MPFGTFLDSFPSMLFVAAHLMFIGLGAWGLRRLSGSGVQMGGAQALYIASQVGFLAFFAGGITMKTAVLIEQTLVAVMVVLVAVRVSGARKGAAPPAPAALRTSAQ
jgi:hypothetical protein